MQILTSLAIRFALYHLNIMVKHDDNRVGIGAKALTGEGYKGSFFLGHRDVYSSLFYLHQTRDCQNPVGISL